MYFFITFADFFNKKNMEKEHQLPEINTQPTNGHSKTEVISSNNTLFWRIFVPVFGTVFFTGLLVAFWVTNMDDFIFDATTFWGMRIFFTILWVFWLYLMYRTLLRLLRVDVSDTHIIVTNYWTTVKYPWSDVKEMTESKRLGRRIVTFHLQNAGRFGNRISFLPGSHYDDVIKIK
jgi:hypothetical protein